MALKKLKTEGSDKEGIREAEIRKQFNGIMYAYGLVQASQIKEDHAKLPTNVRLIYFFYFIVNIKSEFFFSGHF